MTRARPASYGLVTPPPLYRLIDAVLMLFAELVSHAASTLQMAFVRRTRECHTQAAPEVLPRATSGLHQETDISQPSFSGKREARIPGFPVVSTQGTETYSRCALNRDAWDKPKHDSPSIESARTKSPPPNGGGAAGAPISTMAFRWGSDLSTSNVRTRRTAAPHLTCTCTCTCSAHRACRSSPVRERKRPAHA